MKFFLAHWTSLSNSQLVDNVIGVERAIIGNILNIIRIVGTGIGLIMITYMSINYFTADGRGTPWALETKAQIKGTQLKNFIIGAIVFIGASNIIYFLGNFVADIFAAV